jgi:hypothetical protein
MSYETRCPENKMLDTTFARAIIYDGFEAEDADAYCGKATRR